jgi:hypothetical protein
VVANIDKLNGEAANSLLEGIIADITPYFRRGTLIIEKIHYDTRDGFSEFPHCAIFHVIEKQLGFIPIMYKKMIFAINEQDARDMPFATPCYGSKKLEHIFEQHLERYSAENSRKIMSPKRLYSP